jgi:hypothetical protein
MKTLDESTVQELEKRIPELAEDAVKQARRKAMASGRKVVEAVNGQLIEVDPDGTTRVLGDIPAPTTVTRGSKKVRNR